jgi:hypothetical protein
VEIVHVQLAIFSPLFVFPVHFGEYTSV